MTSLVGEDLQVTGDENFGIAGYGAIGPDEDATLLVGLGAGAISQNFAERGSVDAGGP